MWRHAAEWAGILADAAACGCWAFRAQPPTGDRAHDTQFCRNGRKILDPIDKKSKQSSAPYMMAVYRQEGDGRSYKVVRNVYVPLVIGGRRWGDLELAYAL